MASIGVGIHPDPAGITTKHYPTGMTRSFSTLDLRVDATRVSIFVGDLTVLDALQAALDAIRADLPARPGKEDAA